MKLRELTGEFEKRRSICVKADGNSLKYCNREMQHVSGSLYRGRTEQENGHNQSCMMYICYPEQKVAVEIGWFSTDYTVDGIMEFCKNNRVDTQKAFVREVKKHIKNQTAIGLRFIEYLKYIDPSLVEPCMEIWKESEEKKARIRQEEQEKKETEEQRFVAARNAEADGAIEEAIKIVKNGGTLNNSYVEFYESRHTSSRCRIVNYLMKENGVNVPIRTQGWINEKLRYVQIEKGSRITVNYWKTRNSRGSKTFFKCMAELIGIIRMGS